MVRAATRHKQVSAVADGPARRVSLGASCCMHKWTLDMINWPSTVASIVIDGPFYNTKSARLSN